LSLQHDQFIGFPLCAHMNQRLNVCSEKCYEKVFAIKICSLLGALQIDGRGNGNRERVTGVGGGGTGESPLPLAAACRLSHNNCPITHFPPLSLTAARQIMKLLRAQREKETFRCVLCSSSEGRQTF